MVLDVKSFSGTGADLSGSDGQANRVLTLSNTQLTQQNGFLVYASGLALALTTEYTVSHLSSSTIITFLNRLWDDMTVVVSYYQGVIAGLGSDFVNGPLNDLGVLAVRTPVTVTTDFHGNKTYTDGVNVNISIVLAPYKVKYDLDEAGLTKVYDAVAYFNHDVTLNKYDKITHDSKVYRVDAVSPRDFNGTGSFQRAMLFYAEDE